MAGGSSCSSSSRCGRRRRRMMRPPSLLSPLLLFLLAVVTTIPGGGAPGVVRGQVLDVVGDFMDARDYEFCYEALEASDADRDGRVDKEEYVDFTRYTAPPGLLDGVASYSELPLEYRAAFISTACLCGMPEYGGTGRAIDQRQPPPGGDLPPQMPPTSQEQCCWGVEAHIRVPVASSSSSSGGRAGGDPVNSLSYTDRAYLYAACAYAASASETVLQEEAEQQSEGTDGNNGNNNNNADADSSSNGGAVEEEEEEGNGDSVPRTEEDEDEAVVVDERPSEPDDAPHRVTIAPQLTAVPTPQPTDVVEEEETESPTPAPTPLGEDEEAGNVAVVSDAPSAAPTTEPSVVAPTVATTSEPSQRPSLEDDDDNEKGAAATADPTTAAPSSAAAGTGTVPPTTQEEEDDKDSEEMPETTPPPSQPPAGVVVVSGDARVTYSIAVDGGLRRGGGGNSSYSSGGGNSSSSNSGAAADASDDFSGAAAAADGQPRGGGGGNGDEDDDINMLAVVAYLSDLQVAMNRLAPVVAEEAFGCDEDDVERRTAGRGTRRHQQLMLRRRLQQLPASPCDELVQVQLPTKFGTVSDLDCPAPTDFVSDAGANLTELTLCRNIPAIVPLEITFSGEDATVWNNETLTGRQEQVVKEYEDQLAQAIADGRLQEQLDFVNPGSPVTVLPPVKETAPTTDDVNDGGGGGGGSVSAGGKDTTDASSGGDTRRPIEKLSPGAKAGIALAVLAFVLLVPFLACLMRRERQKRNTQQQEEEKLQKLEPKELDHDDDLMESSGEQHSRLAYSHTDSDGDVYLDESNSRSRSPNVSMLDLGATTSSGGGKNASGSPIDGTAVSSSDDNDEDNEERRAMKLPQDKKNWSHNDDEDGDEDGKSDGDDGNSSGWSSAEGAAEDISALHTGPGGKGSKSMAEAGAITLAAIGAAAAASALHEEKKTDDGEKLNESTCTSDGDEQIDAQRAADCSASSLSGPDDNSSPSVAQIETHIEAGDWAAVGATAALLAAASDSQSNASRSAGTRSADRQRRISPAVNSNDAARAAELDQLVDEGDWDGLIAAAAKFEAAAASSNASDRSRTSSSVNSSATSGSETGTGTIGSPSYETTVSESPSKAQRRDEIRSEVVALVRRVVPEEIDNVDEMMSQFKGREEELVETLRTMQERSIAQKARTAGQRAAKVEARRKSKERGIVPQQMRPDGSTSENADDLPSSTPSALQGGSQVSADPSAGETSGAESKESIVEKRTALEMAIDAGDWQAVGEAAALLSDASVATTSSGELADTSFSSVGSSPRKGKNRSLKGVDAERATELDDLVSKGDWAGVMEATKRFNEADKVKQVHKPSSKPTREEEEALKQAELWMELAERKKAEGPTDAGASDAAEWAIQRSLSQMKDADQQKRNSTEGDEEV